MKNLMTYFTLIFFFVTTTALAAVITDDKVELGKPSSTADKQVVFSGPTKKKLTHKNATNTLEYDGNNLTVGDGANSSKVLKFNKGASSPEIRYNSSTSKLEFSNDASVYKAIGSGSGAGSGINLLDNSGFEDGVAVSWTSSGTSLVEANTGSNLLYELKSATWTPNATGHYFESTAVTVPNILKFGQSCMAKIAYQGGDANAYLTVMDGSSVELIPAAARATLNSSSGVKDAKLYFTCPSSGSIKLRVQSTGAMAIAAFDQGHLGQADFGISKQAAALGGIRYVGTAGCSWTTTSTTYVNHSVNASCPTPSATGQVQAPPTKVPGIRIPIASKGTYYFIATGRIQKGGGVDGAAYYRFSDGVNFSGSTGMRNNTSFSGGGVVVGSVILPTDTTNWDVQIQGAIDGAGGTSTLIEVVAGSPLTDFVIDVYYYPSGTDTVVNSKCLNDLACENEFSAEINNNGTSCLVSFENLDWLNGNGTRTASGQCTFTFNTALILASQMNCTTSTQAGATGVMTNLLTPTNTGFQTYSLNTATAAATDTTFGIKCSKAGADFKARQTIQGFFNTMLSPVGFSARSSSGQSIPSAVATTLVMNNENYDSHNAHDTGTGVFSAPENGKYNCSCRYSYASFTPSTNSLTAQIVKNGVLAAENYYTVGTVSNVYSQQVTFNDSLVTGDQIRCAAFQNTGVARALASNTVYNEFSCNKVGN